MTNEILEQRQKQVTVDDSILLVTYDNGTRSLFRGLDLLDAEDTRHLTRYARLALGLTEAFADGGNLVIIGGGLCNLPRLMPVAWGISIYDVEASLARFCPPTATFIVGQWQVLLPDAPVTAFAVADSEPLTDEEFAQLMNQATYGVAHGDIVTLKGGSSPPVP